MGGSWIARPRAEAEIDRWLRQPPEAGASVLAVTGPAGCGKSALVTHVARAAGTVLIDAGGRSTDDVTRAFAVAAEVGPPLQHPALDTAGLIEQVCAYLKSRPVGAASVLALTNIERAGLIASGSESDPLLTELVAALAGTGRVRVLLDVGGERWARCGMAGQVVDLGPGPYAEPGGPAALAESVLLAAQGPYTEDREAARAVAAELAAPGGDADWLTAQLAASVLAAERPAVDVHAPDWPRLVPRGMQAAIDRFAASLGAQTQAARAVLTALAFTHGQVLDDVLITTLAAAVARETTLEQTQRILAAGEGVLFERSEPDGQAAHALRFPGAADRIRERYGAGGSEIEQRIARELWDGPASGSAYAGKFLPSHAAAAGWLEQLLADPVRIASVSLHSLAAVLDATPSQGDATGTGRRALIARAAACYNPDAPEPLRRSALHCTAVLSGDLELAQALATGGALPWELLWTVDAQEVWTADAQSVEAVQLADEADGTAFALSWSAGGQREVRDLHQGTVTAQEQVAAQDRTLPAGLTPHPHAPNCYWMTLENRVHLRFDDGTHLDIPLPGRITDARISGDGVLVAVIAGGALLAIRVAALAAVPGTGAVTLQAATERGREWLRKGGPEPVVNVYEFEFGYVISGGAPKPAVTAGPPAPPAAPGGPPPAPGNPGGPPRPPTALGGSRGVIDKRTARLTYWPSLPPSAIADRYARSLGE